MIIHEAALCIFWIISSILRYVPRFFLGHFIQNLYIVMSKVFKKKDSMKILRRRLRRCTKRLLQVAWQKYKAFNTSEFRRQGFWKIPEAQSVLNAWRASKLINTGFEGDVAFYIEEFLDKAEVVAHPGKSCRFKHHPSSAVHQGIALAAAALQRLAAEVPRLQFQADALVRVHESCWSPEIAALLEEVDCLWVCVNKERGPKTRWRQEVTP